MMAATHRNDDATGLLVPPRVFELLEIGFATRWAREHAKNLARGSSLMSGDQFGTVLGWLWTASPARVAAFVVTYLNRLNDELIDGAVGVEDLIRSLRHRVPTDIDAERLFEHLRSEVPTEYGGHA